ncbi:hypothetical protein SAMN05216206_3215 [Pseudomonas guineae]|uniref:Uncharacterized protein n=1 Tax=Pseudomonas guineae TaxID=425504 RepID=A0A1I3MA76_9PSED|nr:hypothetical protein [Pseudomonas guineae]SFI93812.1 hypothetical protein SAMN05216206_3215 [Pseudomonas guineae]
MFDLRSLLAPRRPMRTFALLNAQGICTALRQSAQAPQGSGWVEVQHSCLSWLGQQLPNDARTIQFTPHPRAQQTLAA